MRLSLIAAVAQNSVIGLDNRLPWNLPEDLKRFRKITMGKPILMGRKTFDSLGYPLPGRENIVVSRNIDYRPPGCHVYHSITSALNEFKNREELIVIGGASFYKQLLPVADRVYLTLIHQAFDGDTVFPVFDKSQWIQIEREDFHKRKDQSMSHSFLVYDRKRCS